MRPVMAVLAKSDKGVVIVLPWLCALRVDGVVSVKLNVIRSARNATPTIPLKDLQSLLLPFRMLKVLFVAHWS